LPIRSGHVRPDGFWTARVQFGAPIPTFRLLFSWAPPNDFREATFEFRRVGGTVCGPASRFYDDFAMTSMRADWSVHCSSDARVWLRRVRR
jgi:hypothetical protein